MAIKNSGVSVKSWDPQAVTQRHGNDRNETVYPLASAASNVGEAAIEAASVLVAPLAVVCVPFEAMLKVFGDEGDFESVRFLKSISRRLENAAHHAEDATLHLKAAVHGGKV